SVALLCSFLAPSSYSTDTFQRLDILLRLSLQCVPACLFLSLPIILSLRGSRSHPLSVCLRLSPFMHPLHCEP
ncbi:hypothetical protein AMELA_G00074740, partial [Ameiurus melas]